MPIKRRDFLLGAASVAMGGPEMPIRLPYGPGALDPRQPRQVVIPDQKFRTLPYTQQPSASPVHLSGSLVLSSGTSGSVPAAALKNPMGQDMELLEIKFEVSGPAGPLANPISTYGASVSCEFNLGSIKVTNGSIPVWSFGRAENIEGETKSDTTDSLAFSSYSWRLPRPLFIPAGAVLIPKFTHTALTPNTLNVRIGYSCRTVSTKPKKIYVPWVAKYTTKAFNPISAAGVDTSSELDLVNPNPEVFHLQRFTGRLQTNLSGTVTQERCPALGAEYLEIKMIDSYGRPIVAYYTPFQSVFQGVTRSWELEGSGAELDPEAYYIVQVRKNAESVIIGPNAYAQAFISMVGWRELEN